MYIKINLLESKIFLIFHFRISLTLACPMDLKLYPLDRQECEMRIASCKYPQIILLKHAKYPNIYLICLH